MQQLELGDFNPTVHECPSCDRSFGSRIGLGRHHSITHGEKLPDIPVECDTCGASITRSLPETKKRDRHFCSSECHGVWNSNNISGENNPLYKEPLQKTCQMCGCDFECRPSEDYRKHCSVDCKHEYFSEILTGDSNPIYSQVELECPVCDDTFSTYPSKAERRVCCSRSCAAEWKSRINGPDHWEWKFGQSFYIAIRELQSDLSWSYISKRTRESHDSGCEMCGKLEEDCGDSLSVHHIVPVMSGGSNGDYNHMVLCRSCHGTVENYTQSIPEVVDVLSPGYYE